MHYKGDVNETDIYKLKENDNIHCFNFCSGSISRDSIKDEQSEISLNRTVYNFSVDHSSFKKEDILNIHEYLMVETNIK